MNTDWLIALGQVLFIDIVLAGDNAIVVGMAAAGLPPAMEALPRPSTTLLLAPEAARDLRQPALDEWLAALSR